MRIFDLSFIIAAEKRCKFKNTPFHAFTVFDTATLSGWVGVCGKIVLAKALCAAKLGFDVNEAHSTIYDAQQTVALFCYIVNQQK